jgi:Uma2 family endonuclease
MERRISAEEYLTGPETVMRRELVWGVLHEPPSPFRAHQGVVTRATLLLGNHVLDEKSGRVYVAPLDVVFDRPNALVLQPDVMFVSHARREILHDFIEGPPDLVVEVISEGSRNYDRISKLAWYREYKVLEYWVIDPEAREIEVIRLDAEPPLRHTYRDAELIQSAVLPGFARTSADFFE